MLGIPVATELLMAVSALFGAMTATAMAIWAFWRKVLRPIRENVADELDAWSEMRKTVLAQFKTNGTLGLRDAMAHAVDRLASIDDRLEAGDRRFACIEQKIDALRREIAQGEDRAI